MGPWSLAYHGFGVAPFLLTTVDDPGRAKACLDRLKEVTVAFGLAQIEAGADALTLPDHATGDLVSGSYYATFLRDLHAELVARLPVPVILHICGRTLDRMPDIARTGVAAFHFESKNDPVEAAAIAEGHMALIGNVNNPQTLAKATPASVAAEVWAALDAGVGLIGPECAVPLDTPTDNLRAIPRAVVEWCAGRGGGAAGGTGVPPEDTRAT
jgi:[methyl-Co(III) methanol-specific corrinoid protein]:coenzyme M methyltransferase